MLRVMVFSGFLLLPSLGYSMSCELLTKDLNESIGLNSMGSVVGKSAVRYVKSPEITFSVSCSQNLPNIAFAWDGPAPDPTFYDLVGTVGNLLSHRPASEVVTYSKQCLQEALNDDSEIATIEREGIVIECQAFKRDGGGTTITIFTE